ncbi:hypothetical protein ACHAXN_011185 [Cyclotella atomus]
MMLALLIFLSCLISTKGFTPSPRTCSLNSPLSTFAPSTRSVSNGVTSFTGVNFNSHRIHTGSTAQTPLFMASSSEDPNETIARRIYLSGDVNGGYYRTCVINEARRFRKLNGTMSPPSEEDKAQIYVEGKRKMVESFVRWCKRGDVGLSQTIQVENVEDEFATGMYDDFYVDTGRKGD